MNPNAFYNLSPQLRRTRGQVKLRLDWIFWSVTIRHQSTKGGAWCGLTPFYEVVLHPKTSYMATDRCYLYKFFDLKQRILRLHVYQVLVPCCLAITKSSKITLNIFKSFTAHDPNSFSTNPVFPSTLTATLPNYPFSVITFPFHQIRVILPVFRSFNADVVSSPHLNSIKE